MKFLIITFLFTAHSAMAKVICDAKEIVAGDSGRRGSLMMGQSPFSLKWVGDSADLIGQGALCGVQLSASTVCQTLDQSSGPTLSARMLCADKDKSPLDSKVGDAYFVYSEVNGVGRFGCSHSDGVERVEKIVEINNCR